MEKDDEVAGLGNSYTTEFRQYDLRIGRWFSLDLIVKPWESGYASFANNPIVFSDRLGLGPDNETDAVVGEDKDGFQNVIGDVDVVAPKSTTETDDEGSQIMDFLYSIKNVLSSIDRTVESSTKGNGDPTRFYNVHIWSKYIGESVFEQIPASEVDMDFDYKEFEETMKLIESNLTNKANNGTPMSLANERFNDFRKKIIRVRKLTTGRPMDALDRAKAVKDLGSIVTNPKKWLNTQVFRYTGVDMQSIDDAVSVQRRVESSMEQVHGGSATLMIDSSVTQNDTIRLYNDGDVIYIEDYEKFSNQTPDYDFKTQ